MNVVSCFSSIILCPKTQITSLVNAGVPPKVQRLNNLKPFPFIKMFDLNIQYMFR